MTNKVINIPSDWGSKIAAIVPIITVLVLGWSYYEYRQGADEVAELCLFGDLAALSYSKNDKVGFCSCMDERFMAQASYTDYLKREWLGADIGVEEMITDSAVRCGQVFN